MTRQRLHAATLLATLISLPQVQADTLDTIVVTATRLGAPVSQVATNIDRLDGETLTAISHTHINEAAGRYAGVWISRGNGQEHLTAIRSPVLTGAGGCGAFLMSVDGISVRAPGFCNVNELFEAPTELAGAIEVIRGPGTALHGSNAVHGMMNVLTPAVSGARPRVQLEGGPHGYGRMTFTGTGTGWRADASLARDGGYKDDAGFGQQKFLVKGETTLGAFDITTTFAYNNLNQETAGFIQGDDVYRDESLKRDNPNPEAYRDVRGYRLSSQLVHDSGEWVITPYIRDTDMAFLQHFLPGQPLEENGHTSVGVQTHFIPSPDWLLGVDAELTDGFLIETQASPTNTGSAFLNATIPAGKHYDYQVDASTLALFGQWQPAIGDRIRLSLGLRAETQRYDYDNRMIDGRTQDNGTPCGFGGCRFSRPSDREDRFTNVSPKLGLTLMISPRDQAWLQLARGFRAPQATELYRLQADQDIANIDSEEITSLEIGVRGGARINYSVSVFAMEKDNFIFRDTNRETVDNGETSHRGVEFSLDAELTPSLDAALAWTLARHRYENNPALAQSPVAGNDIDTAPRSMGTANIAWRPATNLTLSLEWVHLDEYYTDPANSNEYEGHDLVNLRASWQANEALTVFGRVTNVTDQDYAERADFAFGNERYFVGEPRSFYMGIRWSQL